MSGVPRLRLIRYAGLGGALLLALAAYLGGALPQMGLKVTPVSIARGEHGVPVLAAWLVGTALLAGAWWAARDATLSTRWVAGTAALWLLPLAVAPPLGSRDVYSYTCQGATYAAGLDPYTQDVSALPCPWLDSISVIWRDTPAPYGPLFVLLAGAVVAATDSLWGSIALFRALAVAGVALTAACLPVLARRCGVATPRALWLALAGPLVAVHLVSGAHNDALMVGLLVAGLAAVVARPDRPAALLAGGALLGLAVAVKATAVVVLPFAVLVAVAAPRRLPGLARAGGWVAGGAAVAVVAVTWAAGLGFGWVAGLASSGDSVQWTSPPTAVGQTAEYVLRLADVHVRLVPATRVLGIVVLAVVLVVLWWRAVRAPDVPAVLRGAGFALVATVALAPVFHPWYLVWPLAVLAASPARPDRLAAVAVAAAFLVLPDGTALAGFSKLPGAPLMTLAVAVVGVRWLRGRSRPGARMAPSDHDRSAARP